MKNLKITHKMEIINQKNPAIVLFFNGLWLKRKNVVKHRDFLQKRDFILVNEYKK